MGWTNLGSNSGGGEIIRTRPDWPWGPSRLRFNGSRIYFPRVNPSGRGVNHTLHLEPRLKKEWSYTFIPPLDLRGLL
jgi:hypothetical protein